MRSDRESALWPARVKPRDDELLSSWIVRLAAANFLKLHSFCKFVWPNRALWNRDIDKSADRGFVSPLIRSTGTPPARAWATTMASFEGRLYETHNANGNTQWIMPIGVY